MSVDMSDCTGPRFQVDRARWLQASRLRQAYMTCIEWCGGDVVPDGPPQETNGTRWYTATCARCHAAYAWPNGRTQEWFEERHRRRVDAPVKSSRRSAA